MLNKKLCRQISTSPEAAVIPVAPAVFVASAVRGADSVSYTAYQVT
jgi:hypothetical protein